MNQPKNALKARTLVLIGCFVVLIAILTVFGKGASSYTNLLWIGLPLICVVMHFAMGHGKNKDDHH